MGVQVMNEKLLKALQEQLNAEAYSAYLYFSMASWFESENLTGMAHWMKVQAKEELEHAERFYNFINARRQKVNLLPIDGPKTEWSSPLEAFEDAFKHEQVVSKRIHDLLALAIEVKDYPTQEFLQWFVKEQVEEEATADSIVRKLQLVGDSKNALFMLDHALGERDE